MTMATLDGGGAQPEGNGTETLSFPAGGSCRWILRLNVSEFQRE